MGRRAEGWQRTTDAYLESDLTPIMSKVAGYVRDFPIQDFERVRKGQVLTQLVDDDYRAAVAEATANIASATAQARTLEHPNPGENFLQLRYSHKF